MKRLAAIAMILSVVSMLVVFSAWVLIQRSADQVLSLEHDMELVIEPGSTFSQVLNDLTLQGLVSQGTALRAWLRIERSTANIQAGDYDLPRGSTVRDLLALLVSGKVKQYQLTLIEGWTFSQALAAIQSSPRITATLDPKDTQAIVSLFNFSLNHPEGMIFPDTYHYIAGTTDADILRRANTKLSRILEGAWQDRLGALPYTDHYAALIMASIIEKETGLASEREAIASVFINRLALGMRLQSDPTVIYGLGETFDGDLRREHLQAANPYNTYRNSGLPPTPIALVGRDAIIAALRPAPGDFLYFVARGDGSHEFSRTLDEHNAAVTRYQLGGGQQQDP